MTEFFVDFYGCHAELHTYRHRDGARLIIRTSTGAIIHRREYKTHRGAKIAMGKISDGWRRE